MVEMVEMVKMVKMVEMVELAVLNCHEGYRAQSFVGLPISRHRDCTVKQCARYNYLRKIILETGSTGFPHACCTGARAFRVPLSSYNANNRKSS